jgi:hypothetical protein
MPTTPYEDKIQEKLHCDSHVLPVIHPSKKVTEGEKERITKGTGTFYQRAMLDEMERNAVIATCISSRYELYESLFPKGTQPKEQYEFNDSANRHDIKNGFSMLRFHGYVNCSSLF